jgi:AcrR family transcriptional regulator
MSPRTPNQNKEIREQTQQKIKDAAFELFAKKGFSNTSVRSIAQKAGKSKGLIYHYFNSKKEILHAIFDDLTELGKQALNFSDDQSSAEKLEYMLTMILGYIRESSEIIRLMISLALQPDAVAELKSSIDQYNARQIELMKPLFTDLGYEDPETEAFYLAAKLDGITLGYITLGKEYPFESVKQKILDEYVSD